MSLNPDAAVFVPTFGDDPTAVEETEGPLGELPGTPAPVSAAMPSPAFGGVALTNPAGPGLVGLMPVPPAQYDGPPLFSIDVECVAGPGTCGCDRIPASVSVVDQTETVVYESAIKPSAEVSSYLTALTGLKESDLADAPELDAVVADIKDLLSEDAVIVGQGIAHDLEWLGLEEGVDFGSASDLIELFAVRPTAAAPYLKPIIFSLRHVVLGLCGVDIQFGVHNPSVDAYYSLLLFKMYSGQNEETMQQVRDYLSHCGRTPSVREMYGGAIDSVSLGYDWSCDTCKAQAAENKARVALMLGLDKPASS